MFINRQETNPNFIRNILWTDQATFTPDGIFNVHNMHQWAHENPQAKHDRSHQVRFSVKVRAGNILIGPLQHTRTVKNHLHEVLLKSRPPLRRFGFLVIVEDILGRGTINNLIASVPRRVHEVLDHHGSISHF